MMINYEKSDARAKWGMKWENGGAKLKKMKGKKRQDIWIYKMYKNEYRDRENCIKTGICVW